MDFATLRLQPFNIPLFLTSSFPVVALVNKDREILQLLPVSSCSFSFFRWHFVFLLLYRKILPSLSALHPNIPAAPRQGLPRGHEAIRDNPWRKGWGFSPPYRILNPNLTRDSHPPHWTLSCCWVTDTPLHLLSLASQLGISNKLQPPESLPETRNCILLRGYIEKCLVNSLQNKPGWWVNNSLPAKQCGLKTLHRS